MTAKRLLNGFRRGCSSSAIDRKSGSNVKFSKEKKLFGQGFFFSSIFFKGRGRKEQYSESVYHVTWGIYLRPLLFLFCIYNIPLLFFNLIKLN